MKSILIIGASRGIGLELVRQYTEDGRRVIATVRDDAGRERVLPSARGAAFAAARGARGVEDAGVLRAVGMGISF